MLSRVADSLFWLGRYAERAENYSRFIDVNFNLSIDLPPGMKEQWRPLITATGDEAQYKKLYNDYSRENAIRFLAFDKRNHNSIIASVVSARENARQVRENISKETWEVLNDLYHFVEKAAKRRMWKSEDADIFKQIKYKLQLIQGIGYDTSPRNQGWYFTKLGQFLERADKTSRILDVKYHVLLPSVEEIGSPLDFLHWNALLKSVSALNAYKQMYGKIDPGNIVEYLVLNAFFPRSILFCLINAENCLHEISDAKRGYTNLAEKEIGNLRADLEFADINDVFEFGLHEYLDKLQGRINDISTAVYEQYFKIRPNLMDQSQSQ
ncbi:alpha-E domain-containing protein [Marinoscillum sp.]|uniref:alpha-E domain-containing protein n=2 Tax=Marinoscillum sp. TaxID=2024838 RepID=UPI003BAA6094